MRRGCRSLVRLFVFVLSAAYPSSAWALRGSGAESERARAGLEEALNQSSIDSSNSTRRRFITRTGPATLALAMGLIPVSAAVPQPPAPERPFPRGVVGQGPEYSTWVVYWRPAQSSSMLQVAPNRWREVNVFAYHFGGADQLVTADPWVTRTAASLRGTGPRVMMTIVNDLVPGGGQRNRLKDPNLVHRLIETPDARRRLIQSLMVAAQPVDGLDIDFEQVLAADRAAFTAFIEELADALHKTKKTLAVTVQPKTNNTIRNGAGAIDWRAVGAAADRLTIMAYYEHWDTGPVVNGSIVPGPAASQAWLAQVANFAVTQVPPKKLQIAFSLTGFDWPKDAQGRFLPGRLIEYPEAMTLARRYAGTVHRMPDGLRIVYRADGTDHEIWLESQESLKAKAETLWRDQKIRAVNLWRADTWTPEMLQSLAGMEEQVRADQDLTGRFQ